MNYIRGAVNAISAPYQYYKELPPLNPSTLTGAIDVIVVNRPTEDGNDTELVCSPFHVRFGKWQVLRPGDKKVKLTINGRPIPFNMKVGEAGEAFFIFETTSDVPDDLITSPLLTATSPNLEPQNQAGDDPGGRFGAHSPGPEDQTPSQNRIPDIEGAIEPDFLDLNASESQLISNPASGISLTKPEDESDVEAASPSSLLQRTAGVGAAVINSVVETEKDSRRRVKEKVKGVFNPKEKARPAPGNEGDDLGPDSPEAPEPIYKTDVVMDMAGYHSHDRERSDRTVTSKDTDDSFASDRTPGPSRTPSPVPFGPSSSSPNISKSPLPFPIRATSEPPPDLDDPVEFPATAGPSSHTRHESRSATLGVPTEEYMWEWGGFPQKSPLKTTFSPTEGPHGTSKQLFPSRNSTLFPTLPLRLPKEDFARASKKPDPGFGVGGRLRPDREDPCIFTLIIEGKTVQFELSVVPGSRLATSGSLGGGDEVEDAKIFNERKVDFWKFLDDESVLNDEDLVLRWGEDRYITRSDGSPLMDALSAWREATLHDKDTRSMSRSRSPSSRDETLGAKPSSPPGARSTSSPWVRWWSRSRQEVAEPTTSATRPDLRETSSAPPVGTSVLLKSQNLQGSPTNSPPKTVGLPSTAATPPAVLNDTSSENNLLSEPELPDSSKRYAKTLRLTSDQLKLLDLKPGPNTVTFSLAASGVAACTARIFLWDHSDMIVVSDIDGTITKSDALGHVFTMIGRDWTHLGVAKLYTDICRNGYKIMYLTSRAIGQADSTRYYLKGVKQNDYQLPEGPVIMSPDRLMASLHREVIMRKPEVFKMACLRDIRRLFGKTASNPFYSGFGNRITDALSYRSVDVPSSRIFTIDSTGEVKMELLELAGYKSSYIHMTDLVDQMFPPIHRQFDAHFTDFNHWKAPIQEYELPDLSPPSPALSARSDTSNQSTLARLRNLSMMGGRQQSGMKKFSLPPPATESSAERGATERGRQIGTRDSHLRQLSSIERFTNTLSSFVPSSSSTSAASPAASSSTFFDSGDDEYDEMDLERQRLGKKKIRRGSMPGSLPGSEGGSDEEEMHDDEEEEHEGDEGDGDEDYGYDGGHEDEAAEHAFDEDLFATGEMENVPFL